MPASMAVWVTGKEKVKPSSRVSESEGCSTIFALICSLVMNSLIEMAIKSISSEMCAS